MRLTLEQMRSATWGVVNITEGPEGFEFFRFTPEQQAMYIEKREDFGYKSFAASGVRVCFRTDSRSLSLKMRVKNVRARSFFALEVFVNGERIGFIDNFTNEKLPKYYTKDMLGLPAGEYEGSFELEQGEKEVMIYLPWNKQTFLHELVLEDGASFTPVRRDKRLMAFGDSITQGYDALWPSRRYAGRIADALGAEEINKAIGGERFCPDLAALPDDFMPDYITVSYGTNDWSNDPKELVNNRLVSFFAELYKHYPTSRVFVISPIWRPNYETEKPGYESFFDIEKCIRAAIADKPNMTLIPGFDLVPHDENNYADQVLHPNDTGFDFYTENLCKEIQKYV